MKRDKEVKEQLKKLIEFTEEANKRNSECQHKWILKEVRSLSLTYDFIAVCQKCLEKRFV